MGKKSERTKTKILESAHQLFLEKGYDGLRMQQLADRAGVNKGLLHHYFRNKTTLFTQIFDASISQLFAEIASRFGTEFTLKEKINGAVDAYFEMLLANPNLPVFVLSELRKKPKRLTTLFKEQRLHEVLGDFVQGLGDQKAGTHLMVTLVSLCVFPFMARPIIDEILEGHLSFEQFVQQRRPLIKNMLMNLAQSI